METNADARYEAGEQVRVTYAYDGSGVALRALATVIEEFDGMVQIELAVKDGEAAKVLGAEQGIVAGIPRCDISELDSAAKVASFGWLD